MTQVTVLADLSDSHRQAVISQLDCLSRVGIGQTPFEDKLTHKTVSRRVYAVHEACGQPRNTIGEFDPGSA